jgi:hypothetical protein
MLEMIGVFFNTPCANISSEGSRPSISVALNDTAIYSLSHDSKK